MQWTNMISYPLGKIFMESHETTTKTTLGPVIMKNKSWLVK